jgi:hypothetical protein
VQAEPAALLLSTPRMEGDSLRPIGTNHRPGVSSQPAVPKTAGFFSRRGSRSP